MASILRREIALFSRRLCRMPRLHVSDMPLPPSVIEPVCLSENGGRQMPAGSPNSSTDGELQLLCRHDTRCSAAEELEHFAAETAACRPAPIGANRPGSLLIAVVTCTAFRQRADAVRKTWGREARHIVYVVGRPGEPDELVGDMLYLDCPDSFESLAQKTFAMCRYIRNRLDFDRIFICNDDTFVNVAALNAAHCPADFFGHVYDEAPSQGWRVHKGMRCQGEYRGAWVSSGLGYFLSRRGIGHCGLPRSRDSQEGDSCRQGGQ